MPLNELAAGTRVVGEKQVLRALGRDGLQKLFVAKNVEPERLRPLLEGARALGVEVEWADSRLVLGRACAIDRSASAAGLLRP